MSIRCDTASLIPGATVCGVPGLGILGSVILATTGEGGNGPGVLFNDVQSGDEGKEFRAQVETWPSAGVLDIAESGTFTYTGPAADSFSYRGFADGVSYGVVNVVLFESLGVVDVTAAAAGAITHAGTASAAVVVLEDIGVTVAGTGAVAHTGVASSTVELLTPEMVDVSCAALGQVAHAGVVSVVAEVLQATTVHIAADGAVTHVGVAGISVSVESTDPQQSARVTQCRIISYRHPQNWGGAFASDAAEVDDVAFDFGAVVGVGGLIQAVSVEALVVRGKVDEAAQALASGQPVVGRMEGELFIPDASGLYVLQRIDARGRVVGNSYSLRCAVTLSDGRTLVAAGRIAVRRL